MIANPELTLCDASFDNSKKPTAVALSKGNEDLLKIVNKVIKENKDNGNFDKWLKEYSEKSSENAQ